MDNGRNFSQIIFDDPIEDPLKIVRKIIKTKTTTKTGETITRTRIEWDLIPRSKGEENVSEK